MRRPDWTVEGRDWPNRAHSRFVDAGRLRWHVQTMGEGPALLLIHGTGAATHSWRSLAPLLARDFTVVGIDLPGHGFTTGRLLGGMAMSAMARAIGELLRAISVVPEVLVGHSAGAAIAVRMALDGVVAPTAIVGLNAALLPFPGLASRLFPAFARALFVNPFAPHVLARIAGARGEVARFMLRSTGSRIDATGIAAYQRLLATPGHVAGAITMMAEWDLATLERDLPRLATRVLLLHGDADAAIPASRARAAAALIRDARWAPLTGLGHLAHEERPDTVAALIRDFVGEG